MRWRWLVPTLALAVASLVGLGHFMAVGLRGEDETAGAAKQPPFRPVACTGIVDLEDGVLRLNPTVSGRVVDVPVREGDHVSVGTTLLRLDDRLAQDGVASARIALDRANNALEAARKRPEDHRISVEIAQKAIQSAEEQKKTTEKALAIKREQQTQGLGVSREDVLQAEDNVRKADEFFEVKKAELERLRLANPDNELRSAENAVEAAKVALKQTETTLGEYVVTAPTAGTVLGVSAHVGMTLSNVPQQPTIEFGPDSPRIVRAEVQQAFAADITEGLRATIQDYTHAAGTWTGRVKHVSDRFTPKAPNINEPLQPSDVRTMACLIDLDAGQRPLRLGQRVLVVIEVPLR
jgi:multidrug resistance efflux pump